MFHCCICERIFLFFLNSSIIISMMIYTMWGHTNVYVCILERKERKKNFRKTNCWKKRNDIAKKSTTTMKNVLYRINDNERWIHKHLAVRKRKKKNMYRWNKLLVLTTSELTQCESEREWQGRGSGEWERGEREEKNQSIRNDFTGIWKNVSH
jgi:hypothetical protein